MFSTRSPIYDRLLQFLAWFVFGFCSVVIVTGMLVGQTSTSVAQEQEAPGADVGLLADAGEARIPSPEEAIDAEVAAPEGEPEPRAEQAPPTEAQPAEAANAEEATEQVGEAPPETVTLRRVDRNPDSSILDKGISFLGIFALLGVALLLSNNRRRVNWKLVSVGVGLQLAFALLIFYVPGGQAIFEFATIAVKKLLDFTAVGSEFIFASFVTGKWDIALINFSFAVLPTIIFFSALMTILYHLGIMQKLVHVFAWVMQKTMNISGAESMSAAANIFVGQTEAPLVVKPYVNRMTVSELMVVMTGGFATVAGGVLAIYVGMLEPSFPDIAGHLLAASVMSAPAALVIAKIMYPETGTPETMGQLKVESVKEDANVLDAASRGAAEGLKLALNVGAMLLAFIALIALINYLIGMPSLMYNKGLLAKLVDFYGAQGLTVPDGCMIGAVADEAVHGCVKTMQGAAGAAQSWVAPMITMQDIFGIIFWPFAWVMGVPAADCYLIGRLLGEKMVINELVAYASLQQMLANPDIVLSDRSIIIATYALCGFANFGSIGIQLGGIGGIAPDRKHDLAKIAMKAMIGGTLAAFMTATIAGILI
jgi:concentrative nucleoside transporter, CNT family